MIKKITFSFTYLCFIANFAWSSPKTQNFKTKFYNFDELLINGEYKKPQLMFVDTKQKVRFEKLLKLKKDFLLKLKSTEKDPSLR